MNRLLDMLNTWSRVGWSRFHSAASLEGAVKEPSAHRWTVETQDLASLRWTEVYMENKRLISSKKSFSFLYQRSHSVQLCCCRSLYLTEPDRRE